MDKSMDDIEKWLGDICRTVDENWTVSDKFNKRISAIGDIIKNTTTGVGVKVGTHLNKPFRFMSYISVCGKNINFNPTVFSLVCRVADNVEMYPKTNGGVQVNFTFSELS